MSRGTQRKSTKHTEKWPSLLGAPLRGMFSIVNPSRPSLLNKTLLTPLFSSHFFCFPHFFLSVFCGRGERVRYRCAPAPKVHRACIQFQICVRCYISGLIFVCLKRLHMCFCVFLSRVFPCLCLFLDVTLRGQLLCLCVCFCRVRVVDLVCLCLHSPACVFPLLSLYIYIYMFCFYFVYTVFCFFLCLYCHGSFYYLSVFWKSSSL